MPFISDHQNIVLNIDVHRIPLLVLRDDEILYRDAAKMLNERFRYYQQKYPKESTERIWVYTALDMALNLNSDARDKSLEPVQEKINELNKKILDIL